MRRTLLLSFAFTLLVLRQMAAVPQTSPVTITITEGTAMRAVASTDADFIAIDLLGAIWVLPAQGGNARRVTPETMEARYPTWSPDGKLLAFQGYEENNWHIYTVVVDGTGLRRLTDGPFDDQGPDFAEDGRLLFSSDRTGGGIWLADVRSGAVSPISSFAGETPCWVSEGSEALFYGLRPGAAASERTWWIADVPSRTEKVTTPRPERLLFDPDRPSRGNPSRCDNGRMLGATQPSPTKPDGPYEQGEDVFPYPGQRLRSGELLYTADGHIKRRPAAGGPGTVVPFSATLTIQPTQIIKKHRVLQPDERQQTHGIVNPAVSPSGRQIAFTALGDLWLLTIGEPPRQLTDDPYVDLDPAWSPDGTRLVFVSDRGGGQTDLWVYDINTEAFRQLTHETEPVSLPSWSPDGQLIAYVVARRDLRVTDAARNTNRMNARGGVGLFGRPTWTPKYQTMAAGTLFPYSLSAPEGTNQLTILTLSQARTTSVLIVHKSAGDRETDGPVWSPGGSHVAYVSEGQLWTLAVNESGQPAERLPVLVTDDMPSAPTWQGDSQRLVYITPDGLRSVGMDGGRPQIIPSDLHWSLPAPLERVVVHAGALFDGRSPDLRSNVDIVIEKGRIIEIAGHRDALHAAEVIDASEKTVIPGLIDTHVSLDSSHGESLGRLFLAYGITTVRDFATDTYGALERRDAYDAGRRAGPRVFTSGDPFTGVRTFDPGGVAIGSDEQLAIAVERAMKLRPDFLLTAPRLGDRYQQQLTTQAHEHGMPVVTPIHASAGAFGMDGIPSLAGRSRLGPATRVSRSGNKTYRDVVDFLVASGTPLTPALTASTGLSRYPGFVLPAAREPRRLEDPRLQLIPAPELQTLKEAAAMLAQPRNLLLLAAEEERLKTLGRTIAAIAAAGGHIAAGTGAPVVPYGASLHDELEHYVKGGFTSFQALQSATIHAAEALGIDDVLGTLEPGKLADMAILDGDPLQNIRNTVNVQGVLRGGWYYDRESLQTRTPALNK